MMTGLRHFDENWSDTEPPDGTLQRASEALRVRRGLMKLTRNARSFSRSILHTLPIATPPNRGMPVSQKFP
jgi:hypothetical protein